MNTVYLVRSILECVDRDLVCQQTHVKVCNLEPSMGTVVLLLSILTSAAMLGYKIARTPCLRLRAVDDTVTFRSQVLGFTPCESTAQHICA